MGRNKGKNRGPVKATEPRKHEITLATAPVQPVAKASSHTAQTRPKSETGAPSSGPSRAQDLAQQRAKHAWETVKAAKDKEPAAAKDFGGQAKRLPMRIRAAGLGQALAFVRAKAKPKNEKKVNPGLILLLERLGGWVLPRLDPAVTAPVSDSALLQAILGNDATFLRRATLEAMAWLEWVNRFAEAEDLGDDDTTERG